MRNLCSSTDGQQASEKPSNVDDSGQQQDEQKDLRRLGRILRGFT